MHLAGHTVFSACGVMVALYQRNTFDTQGNLSGIKTCIKILSVERRRANDYGSFKDVAECISMELELPHAQKLGSVLYGRDNAMQVAIVRKGKPKKEFSLKKQNNPESPFYFSLTQGNTTHATPLTGADGWHFLMVITQLLKVLHPGIDDKVLIETFIRTA